MSEPHGKKARQGGGHDAVVSSRALPNLGNAMWVAVDPLDGETLFVCSHYAILVVSPTGVISILAGGKQGFKDGVGRDARFNIPRGIVVDKEGNILIADCNNHAVRKVSRSGHTTTIAGNGEVGFADGLGAAARFSHPFGVALDKEGCLYIADFNNNAIRKLSPSGAVTTIAGNGVSGFSDGSALQARFKAPYGIAVDKDGIMYVSDSHNHAIRKVIPGTVHGEATVSTIAGAGAVWSDGIAGFADGPGEQARFNRPAGIAIDSEKNIIVSDSRNNRIRKIESASGGFVVTTIAGASEAGDANGTGMAARFWDPSAVVLDGKGRVLVAEKERVDILRIVDGEFAGPLWFGWTEACAHSSRSSGAGAAALKTALGSMLEDPDLTDITFVVEGERFQAHRCLLAVRSEFFRGLFKSGMQGGQAGGSIPIKDVSARGFRTLLHYLYTNELPEETEQEISGKVQLVVGEDGRRGAEEGGDGLQMTASGQRLGELLQVADRFQVEDMLKRGLAVFELNLAVENAIGHLVWAHLAGPEAAQRIALKFAAQNLHQIQRDAPATFDLLRQPIMNDVAVELLKTAGAGP